MTFRVFFSATTEAGVMQMTELYTVTVNTEMLLKTVSLCNSDTGLSVLLSLSLTELSGYTFPLTGCGC